MNAKYDFVDLEKLLLSIMVVMIHTKLLGFPFNAILRVAVPIFFMYSSFFFFSSTKPNLKKFLKRTLLLYLCWFIILSPITYIVRSYNKLTVLEMILDITASFLKGSTFLASWYLSALIISVTIIYLLKRFFHSALILVFTIPCYILSLVSSNYYFLIDNNIYLESIYNSILLYLGSPINNFIVALFWISVGNLLADKKEIVFKTSKRILLGLSIFSCALLLLESIFISSISNTDINDCYVSLIPFSISVVCLSLNQNTIIKNNIIFRKLSTFIYCFHFSLAVVISNILEMMNIYYFANRFFSFIFTILICIISFDLFYKLSKTKHFSFLKYTM